MAISRDQYEKFSLQESIKLEWSYGNIVAAAQNKRDREMTNT